MNKFFKFLSIFFLFTSVEAKDLPNCEWNNPSGTPCLTIFSAPNTSSINEKNLGKTVITKNK